MVVQDFLDYINKFRFVHTCGAYDIFDRCVYILTFSIILVCSATITIKSYILEPMSCYISTPIGEANILPYVNNYCWIIGTIAKGVHQDDRDDKEYWKNLEPRRINYYQWVPFMLGLQAAILYLPYVFWECLIYNRLGTNIQFIIDQARRSSLDYGEGRQQKLSQMARNIFVLLTSKKRKNEKSRQFLSKLSLYKMEIFLYYFLLKLTSIVLLASQFFIMDKFLNMNKLHFGASMLWDLIKGRYWDTTKLFPRMGFCQVPIKIHSSPMNVHAQCSLSVNILNEKIFIFLWWWFLIIVALQIIGCSLWIWRCLLTHHRFSFIKHSLFVNKPNTDQPSDSLLRAFDADFLSIDGAFLVHMTRLNCGDLISNELLQHLLVIWSVTCQPYADDNPSNNRASSVSTISKDAYV